MSAISIPGYEVVEVIGRGGFGVVYRARQVDLDREVAVRVDTRVLRDQRRFLREFRAVERLSAHPHVVETYDAGVLPDGRPYLVMELCPGGSLADRGPMPPREVAETGQKIADALAAAHDLGVLHGDIKPGNILVKRHGTVALADFGLAAVIEAGDSSGTLTHAASETVEPRPPTPRSDIYALTATLYTLLAGFPPRLPEQSGPEDLPVSPEFMAILRRGLAKDPAHRYQEAAALRADLSQLTVRDLSSPRPTVTTPVTTDAESDPSAPPPAAGSDASPPADPPMSGRRVLLVGAVLLATVVLVAAVVFFLV